MEHVPIISELRPWLWQLHALCRSVSSKVTIFALAVCSAGLVPELKEVSFLAHFISTFIAGFGGGTISGLLIMNPKQAPLGILSSDYLGFTWLLCWWAMNYCPYGIPSKMFNFKPVQTVLKALVAYNRANMLISRVDAASQLFPDVTLAPVILGTISASAGKMAFDLLTQAYGVKKGCHEVTHPTYTWRSGFLSTLFYYFLAVYPSPIKVLAKEEAAALLFTLFVVHRVASDLTSHSFDWTEPCLQVVLTLCNIPRPGSLPALVSKEGSRRGSCDEVSDTNASVHADVDGPLSPVRRGRQLCSAGGMDGEFDLDPFTALWSPDRSFSPEPRSRVVHHGASHLRPRDGPPGRDAFKPHRFSEDLLHSKLQLLYESRNEVGRAQRPSVDVTAAAVSRPGQEGGLHKAGATHKAASRPAKEGGFHKTGGAQKAASRPGQEGGLHNTVGPQKAASRPVLEMGPPVPYGMQKASSRPGEAVDDYKACRTTCLLHQKQRRQQ